ncbi:hypothetical protein GYH30_000985 [Glycine max]|nr:hypothetical protein GYH30_000985 [Glycine max]
MAAVINQLYSSTARCPRSVAWVTPHLGTVKINVEGSSRGNPGNSGFGGLLRDNLGQ